MKENAGCAFQGGPYTRARSLRQRHREPPCWPASRRGAAMLRYRLSRVPARDRAAAGRNAGEQGRGIAGAGLMATGPVAGQWITRMSSYQLNSQGPATMSPAPTMRSL